jgi:succinyl-CoA synthetase alpha subunit
MPGTPIVACIGGRNAPAGKSLGHAGAIVSGNFGTAQSKIDAFRAAGVPVAERPSEIPRLLAERMSVRA